MEETAAQPTRLDMHVASQLPDVSRAFASKLIGRGDVLVNGSPQLKAGYRLHPADEIIINYQPELATESYLDLPVIYEDKSCVVIDKPPGILTHSKGAFNPEPTVATWLNGRIKGLSGERAGIVHRLDRATSGVMICAKNPEALKWLQKQFSQRKVKKTYLAVVSGTPKQGQAIIEIPIERNPKKPQTFRPGANGKPAVTAYSLLASNSKHSLLELMPVTGRTHQLRVHLNHIGLPIMGDTLYGGEPADRLYLHAVSLEITLPNKQHKVFESPMPVEFNEAIR